MMKILVFGGAHIDRRGTLSAPFTPGSSHPGIWHEEAGGGAFNAARCLALLGHQVTLIAPRGGDAAGDLVTEAAQTCGIIDRPFTFLDRSTPSYTAILDCDGNAIAGLADMELYKLFSPRRLRVRSVREAISDCDAIFTDANLPTETLSAIAQQANLNGKFLAALGISPAKVLRLTEALPQINCLFINAAEAYALTQESTVEASLDRLKSLGLGGVVITHGKDMVHAYFNDQISVVQPPPCNTIIDVTGAGDALAGATLSALLSGSELHIALRDGIAAAQITLASRYAVAPNFSEQLLAQTVQRFTQAKLTFHS